MAVRSDFSTFLKQVMAEDVDVAAILAALQNQVGQPRSDRGGVSLRVSDSPTPPDVEDLVSYMNYDGDPNMGLLKGLFGGRAQPARLDPLKIPMTNDRAMKHHRRGK
jgi:hypothetical protein